MSNSSKPERRWYQYSLTTLLLVFLVVNTGASWIAVMYHQAKKEKAAVAELERLGATWDDWVGWREVLLGSDYAPIVQADLSGVRDVRAALKHVRVLADLEWLSLAGTAITDDDLQDLKVLTRLDSLDLSNTQVTDEGAAKLQEALPDCEIIR